MTTIYHNPRCSKSRQCLAILEDKKEDLEIIKYLDTPLTENKLKDIINLLDIKPMELVSIHKVGTFISRIIRLIGKIKSL